MRRIILTRGILAIGVVLAAVDIPGIRAATRLVGPPPGWSAIPRNCTNVHTSRRVALVLAPEKLTVRSGMAAIVLPSFVNHGRRSFTFFQRRAPGMTFIVTARYDGTGAKVPWTRLGKCRAYNWSGPTISPRVLPQHSLKYWKSVNMARYVDLSRPGKYRVVLTAGKIRSNAVVVTVLPPRTVPPPSPAIRKAPGAMAKWLPVGKGVQIYARPVASATVPEVRVYFRDSGRHSASVSLSGRPLSDLAVVEVTGPTGAGEVALVRHLKPGQHGEPYTPPPGAPASLSGMRYAILYQNRKPTRESLYGLWLSKHSPKGLKWKTYTLKPGVVYEYAEPLYLSSLYDMSLSGVYRVRVKLAHTHNWSPWVKIVVVWL